MGGFTKCETFDAAIANLQEQIDAIEPGDEPTVIAAGLNTTVSGAGTLADPRIVETRFPSYRQTSGTSNSNDTTFPLGAALSTSWTNVGTVSVNEDITGSLTLDLGWGAKTNDLAVLEVWVGTSAPTNTDIGSLEYAGRFGRFITVGTAGILQTEQLHMPLWDFSASGTNASASFWVRAVAGSPALGVRSTANTWSYLTFVPHRVRPS